MRKVNSEKQKYGLARSVWREVERLRFRASRPGDGCPRLPGRVFLRAGPYLNNNLLEIAEHFDALAAALSALRDKYAHDPETVARLDAARHRALRGADLAKDGISGGDQR